MDSGGVMREILLHGGSDDVFDRSVAFARRLAESFAAQLHVVYTVEEPLSGGWTAEVSAERLPELHQAMEAEARERLARLIPVEDQERLGVRLALRTGPAVEELVRYTVEHPIDLAIVQAPRSGGSGMDVARALLDHGQCAVLVLR
jgi:nucleotide-binding universal stress UspA family protein